jgi:iron complex transport system substrate-binding protein
MNTKYIIIAAVVAVVLIVSGAFVYIYYQGQAAESERIKALQSLVDDHGYVTSLSAYPNRIISLAPSTTEILFALDLGDKVVAVTDYDNYPYDFSAWIAAGNMTSVGAFDKPNIEVIASLDPDLILATAGVQGETVDTMRDLGYKVLVLDPANITGVFKNIELVGKATGKNAEASLLVTSLSSRIDAVINKVANASKPKVYYEVWYDSTSLWGAGSKAWQNELIEKAGGINIFADQPLDYFQSSSEAVVVKNPDVIVLPAGGMGAGEVFWGNITQVKARPAWDSISAVQNDRLYQIDSDVIQRAGPRVADAVETLAKFFHPELF